MKFICDFCNSVVSASDNQCSNCGALFADVRCPNCEYKSEAENFINGCPNCKYDSTITNLISRTPLVSFSSWGMCVVLLTISITLMILVLYNIL